jgi:phage host-nuclease inhibitor protein Gam
MSTKRIKKAIITNVSFEDAQQASETFAQQQNRLSKLEAKMNEEINKVKSKYQDDITEIKENIEEPMQILEVYANEQKSTWGKKKSFELLHSVIGFRTGTPAVTKSKKVTWEFITDQLAKTKDMLAFVRTKQEINKEAILAEQDENVLSRLKEEFMVEIEQKESFYVQVKQEEVATI